MSDFDWSERFPEMRPVRTAPSLVRINGIGCGVYGSRDADPETGTYVTTYCFSLLFLPLFALTAYRVADAPNGGWYFLGRVPLSAFARTWNVLVLLAIAGGAGAIGWNAYTHSLDYVAGQHLAEADALAANGQVAQAASLYRDVALGVSKHASEAGERLRGLLDDPAAQSSLANAAEVYRAAIQARQRTGLDAAKLEERGLALLDQHADKEPRQALAFLDVIRPLNPDSPKLAARRKTLLERSVDRDPKDVALVSELALLYEADHQWPRCEAILLPIKDQLGDSDGARILGQILARKGKIDDACILLEGYTEKKLQQYHAAKNAFDNAQRSIIPSIQQGTAPGFPYQRFKEADDAGKQAILIEYLQQRLKDDPTLKQQREAYENARAVVPAVLDLGMVLLRRGQMQREAADREADLKKAEKAFLALQNEEAAESTLYRLELGQVYYWLGKHAEGHKKFDEVLAAEQRRPEVLMQIARLLREVGTRSEACTLCEEAYDKEQDKDKKFQIALSRGVMAVELDDKIKWLQRCDPAQDEVKANLSEAQAEKALEEGKPAEAEPHLRRAIEIYAKMPEDEAILNNSALTHLQLYRVTGDRRLLAKAETMLSKAVDRNPRNSLYLENAADALLEAAARDVIGPAIDLTALKKTGSRSLLSFLWNDLPTQRRLIDRYCKHPATEKALGFLERLLILAPKKPKVYRQLVLLYEDQGNLDKLRDLAARLQKGSLDLSSEEQRSREVYAGKRDEKVRRDLQAQLDQYAKLVEQTGKGQRGVSYAVAATDLASLKLSLARFGVDVDADEVVKLAETAHQAAPSFATRRELESALLFRASGKLSRQNAAFAALAKRTQRSLSPGMLIATALEGDTKLRERILADADVKRTLVLIREGRSKAPDVASSWGWMMMRAEEQEAARFAQALKSDTISREVRDLYVKLYPFSPEAALRSAWALRAAGKEQEAAALLKQFADRGVPLP